MDSSLSDNLGRLMDEAMAADRHIAKKILKRIDRSGHRTSAAASTDEKDQKKAADLEKRLKASARRVQRRRQHLPAVPDFPDLPIFEKKEEIVAAIRNHPVVIISGETGSGKTTQIPKYCLAAGRGIAGKVGCTQPRRIAAITVANRIAEEIAGETGRSVGYKIRFADRIHKDAYIKIMTDGILLAEAQRDPLLLEYDTIIVDEAHERSLNIDFILGILKTLVQRRDDLKIIITSATIDTEKFSKAFGGAPVIEVSGRMYPVEVRYAPCETEGNGDDAPGHVEAAVREIETVRRRDRVGDILVFMPTEQDIRDTCTLLEGRKWHDVIVLPLFARLSAKDQANVFLATARQKIVVATNVAETSITIPGIRYVVDSGLARISMYSPRTRTTSLPVSPVSKSSADQRKGRCGRVENGVCIRLYEEQDYENRPMFTPPEILRTHLAEVILRMTALDLGDVSAFPFIDPPTKGSIRDGYRLLTELGAIAGAPANGGKKIKKNRMGTVSPYVLTDRGRKMAQIPLDPRLSRMLLEANRRGCIKDVLVIAAAMSIQDPKERPAEKAQEADAAQRQFTDPASDFAAMLNLWRAFMETTKGKPGAGAIKKFCKAHFLSFNRMREWRDIHGQISQQMTELFPKASPSPVPPGPSMPRTGKTDEADAFGSYYTAIHTSILTGFLSNIAMKKEKNLFRAAYGREAMIFPGSGVFHRAGNWIVAGEMVETSRLFARTVATIDVAWLEELAGELCKRTYLDPHWERNRGQVVAMERVTLFGLTIADGRPVSFGRIDPSAASDIFVTSALLDEDMKKPLGFMVHNRKLIEEIRDMENRMRRRDLLVNDTDIHSFYRRRLGDVYDIRTLKRMIRDKGGDGFLRMKKKDLLLQAPDVEGLAAFPDAVRLDGQQFSCDYRFDPGDDRDGLTVKIPADRAATVAADAIDWMVPGFRAEKIEALLRGLPKKYRKRLVPVADTAKVIVREMDEADASLLQSMGQFIHQRFGLHIPASAWQENQLPDHLKPRIALVDGKGKEIRAARDRTILQRGADGDNRHPEIAEAARRWEKTEIKDWDFDDLPESIPIRLKGGGEATVWPALESDQTKGGGITLRLFSDASKAAASHRKGVAALSEIHLAKDVKQLASTVKLPASIRSAAACFGGAVAIESSVTRRVVADVLEENVRTKEAFQAHIADARRKMIVRGQELLSAIIPVVASARQALSSLATLAASRRSGGPVLELVTAIEHDVRRLVPDHFVTLYAADRMADLSRYLDAARLRAERAVADIEKDRKKEARVRGFTDALEAELKALSPDASEEKREALESFFWMLEEFKVSVYAQDLKTAYPVSEKRLKEKLSAIQRMV